MNASNEQGTTSERVDSLVAFEQLQAEIAAVPDEALVPINVDVLTAVTIVIGALPELRALRAELVEKLPTFDVSRLDQLEAYARAAAHAHALHLQVTTPSDIAPLAQAGAELRDLLLTDATALARRGLVDGQKLNGLKGPVGHRNLAFDLSALASVLREAWSKIEGKTAITPEELNQARLYADELITAVGLREQGPPAASESALRRQRAFTLLVQVYNQVRRAVAYLRWDEGDLDRIAPSLYERRGSRRRPEEAEPALSPTAIPTPIATAATAPAPTRSNVASPAAAVATGLPGESPFEE